MDTVTKGQIRLAHETWLDDYDLNPDEYYAEEEWEALPTPQKASIMADYLFEAIAENEAADPPIRPVRFIQTVDSDDSPVDD